ncbi:hypothetical protein [Streptomyces sp. NPDC006510]|uniref:hypothetical protein n=1 Tax=Streptomyces sp. NPDC006510 TaxID=3155600 RepID=UPI00339EFA08
MTMRRNGGNAADDNAGWTMDKLRDGTLIRTRVHPEHIGEISDHHRTILTEEARGRGMTLLEYVGWVGRMPKSELHVYRDQVRSGSGGPRLAAVYDAWLSARMAVTETQSLQRGWGPGEPDRWI